MERDLTRQDKREVGGGGGMVKRRTGRLDLEETKSRNRRRVRFGRTCVTNPEGEQGSSSLGKHEVVGGGTSRRGLGGGHRVGGGWGGGGRVGV